MNDNEEAKNFLLDIIIERFDFDDIGFHRKKDKHNDHIFVTWLIEFLNKFNTNNAMCLSINPINNERLKEYVSPMTYLNYSPKDDEDLGENEIKIDLNEARKEVKN